MSTLVDSNERPIKTEESTNGHAKEGKVDVRAIPMGTLIYNLIRYTGEVVGMENAIHQLEQIKEAHKMVNDHPQLEAVRNHLKHVEAWRYLIANEINIRFADVDKARLESIKMEVVDLTQKPAETPPPATEPETKQDA